jgi:hydroxymethylbilane synthase
LRQVEEIKSLFPCVDFEVIKINTQGDKDKLTALSKVENSDFFTREIDLALLSGAIDLGLHSSKDLPAILPKGLTVIFETPSISPYDALVSKGKLKLKSLPQRARVGTSSLRRKLELYTLRKDLVSVEVRGNIQERLALINEGKIDALIVAHAALIRLGLEEKIAETFPLDIFTAHPKQGSLSLVTRSNDKNIIGSFNTNYHKFETNLHK